MKKHTAGWLIAAAVLIVLGLAVFAAAMAANHWDFSGLNTKSNTLITRTCAIPEEFTGVSLDTDTADIRFVPSADGSCTVTFRVPDSTETAAAVRDGTLEITMRDDREWYEYIGIVSNAPTLTVSMPAGDYALLSVTETTGELDLPKDFSFGGIGITASTGDITCRASASDAVRIATTTGDITLGDMSAASVSLSVTTGDITAENIVCSGAFAVSVSTGEARLSAVRCGSLESTGSTGDLTMKDVIVQALLSAERSTGDIRFEKCDAGEISVRTGTGSVTGSLLSGKIFLTETGTGDVKVPKTDAGGRCDITTGTGDIRITLS